MFKGGFDHLLLSKKLNVLNLMGNGCGRFLR